MNIIKDLSYYMKLSYDVVIKQIEDEDGGGFLITIPQLKGCMSDGETVAEAYENITEAKREWFSDMLGRNIPIPEPTDTSSETYSGRFVVRMPKSLHKTLAELSKAEGVSLNQYITTKLAFHTGVASAL